MYIRAQTHTPRHPATQIQKRTRIYGSVLKTRRTYLNSAFYGTIVAKIASKQLGRTRRIPQREMYDERCAIMRFGCALATRHLGKTYSNRIGQAREKYVNESAYCGENDVEFLLIRGLC